LNVVKYIARRYLFSKSGNNAINVIVKVASFGVMVVSAAFIIVLSGFSGIRTFNLNLIKQTDADLKITPKKGKTFLFDEPLQKILQEEKLIKNFSKVVEEKVFIIYEDKQKIAKIKGVDSNYYKVINLESSLLAGRLPEINTNELLMGVSLANELSFMLSPNSFEVIQMYVPKPGKGLITHPKNAFFTAYFIPVGIYQTTLTHDRTYLFADISRTQQFLHYQPKQISAIEIKLVDSLQVNKLKTILSKKIGKNFEIKDRKEQNKLIYRMLNVENLMVYFVFALILLLALFNIIGSVIMIIIDKREDIHILRVLGLDLSEIKKIFMIQGFFMTILSGLSGLVFGLLLVFVQLKKPFLYIPQANMPYPVEIHFTNILWVILTLLFLGFISTYVAVLSVSKSGK